MSLIDRVHGGYVFPRRLRVLSGHLAELLPHKARVLDVGCGDGGIAHAVLQQRPDLEIIGIDVLVRERTLIPVTPFDGRSIPFPDAAFDATMLVDVVHHAADPMRLLRECSRVAAGTLVIKDHLADRFLARPTLRLMDVVGNARHGVRLPFDYWSRARWLNAFAELGLRVELWRDRLGLYPAPASWVFESSLHFLALLGPLPRAA
jgi:SAM-dependent methyltransferase